MDEIPATLRLLKEKDVAQMFGCSRKNSAQLERLEEGVSPFVKIARKALCPQDSFHE